MNKLVKTLLVGAGAVTVFNLGKFLNGVEYTSAMNNVLAEHDLTIKEAYTKVPLWMPVISATKVSLKKLSEELEEESQ